MSEQQEARVESGELFVSVIDVVHINLFCTSFSFFRTLLIACTQQDKRACSR